jgi:septal ring factor EnvC (AmiA/AmiB activator)
MDIIKALRELHAERKRLNSIIASLEAQLAAARKKMGRAKAAPSRRGRKSMSAAERLAVSKRMTLYWEARRAQLDDVENQAEQSNSTAAW